MAGPEERRWVRTPVDAFILARLRREGLQPAPEADHRTLIRRVTFDLTGLPPTPEEVAAFEADASPDAYERLVERLLASPHYGEHWGRHWLDVARYAETEGFEYDRHRPGVWRYRDWVIAAFNDDKPYDRFITEQLAGDEIDPENLQLQIAAGYLRLGPVRRNAGNQELAFSRHDVLAEMTDALGVAFLGLTVGCARCHDHKFDPIPQADYYRLQAFLASAQEHEIILASKDEKAKWKEATDKVQADIRRLQQKMLVLEGDALRQAEIKLHQLEMSLPPPLPAIDTVRDDAKKRTPVHVLKRGNTDRPGKQVGPRFPGFLASTAAAELPADVPRPRTLLAQAIVRADNPLTARVWANRVWQYHFGKGLVATSSDFGANGSPPSHPELLDWLAEKLVAGGWRTRPLHRAIVLSSTYRQASFHPDSVTASRIDPENRLLGRFPRRRLAAEEVRDAMLFVAGRLNVKAGGPSVSVPVEKDLVDLLYAPSQWSVTPGPQEHDRRSIYLLAKRNLRLPFFEAFDQPDAQTSCARRESSTHALQALELLNGRLTNDLAGSFARRLAHEAGPQADAQVERAYLLAAGRPPTPREKGLAVRFLQRQPLRDFALAVLNLNAFLYVH